MKNIIQILFVILGVTSSFAQEVNEYSGENFSLEGALEMFKKSNSLEEFEKLLNTEENNVNNLDLNKDEQIDYIQVESIKEGDTHIIVLSTFLNEKDIQDIATIGIEKKANEYAILQIEGDESLFSENTIVEPFEVEDKIQTSDYGPNEPIVNSARIVVNVWFWPCVKFMYHPNYVVWKSPYKWKRYPNYWNPWKPVKYVVFTGRCVRHSAHFHRTKTNRVVVAKKIYIPRRKAVVAKAVKKTKAVKRRAKTRRR